MPGTLFLVATPIGNLEDITLRALRVLREVSLVAAEDTRHTAKLLAHFDIHVPTTSFYEQIEHEKTPRLLARLVAGDNLALVSDAGTPGISDPGYRLVKAAVEAGIRVEAVPGPSALLTALVASGLPTNSFAFLGFPPPRLQARDRWFESLAGRQETLIFYEAPHRIRETLAAALRALGDRPVCVARELTKLHEELVRGPISAVLPRLLTPRGEFTIVLGPAAATPSLPDALPSDAGLFDEFYHLTEDSGLARRPAISRLAEKYGLSAREVYAAVERAKASVDPAPDLTSQ
ncbi:MAG TPA: 16S rRNA (cytidine(1402)-2'-O)-methyltransferase [Vicinamibacterales bacterium]|jgi:16S rRNA (cytidine1402-2'-O)-methyltransferase